MKNFKKFLKKDDNPKTKPIFVNNYSWLKGLNYISFKRYWETLYNKQNANFESVKTRLDRAIFKLYGI